MFLNKIVCKTVFNYFYLTIGHSHNDPTNAEEHAQCIAASNSPSRNGCVRQQCPGLEQEQEADEVGGGRGGGRFWLMRITVQTSDA